MTFLVVTSVPHPSAVLPAIGRVGGPDRKPQRREGERQLGQSFGGIPPGARAGNEPGRTGYGPQQRP